MEKDNLLDGVPEEKEVGYKCSHCGHWEAKEKEVLCWKCGVGEMLFQKENKVFNTCRSLFLHLLLKSRKECEELKKDNCRLEAKGTVYIGVINPIKIEDLEPDKVKKYIKQLQSTLAEKEAEIKLLNTRITEHIKTCDKHPLVNEIKEKDQRIAELERENQMYLLTKSSNKTYLEHSQAKVSK